MDNTEYEKSWMAGEEPHPLATEADAARKKQREQADEAMREFQEGFDEEPGSETAKAEIDRKNGAADN